MGGSGSIGAATTLLSAAHLAPGTGIGTMTFTAGLALNAGIVIDFQLGTVSNEVIVSGGVLSGPAASHTLTLNLSNAGGFNVSAAGNYTLFSYAGATPSGFDAADFTLGTLLPGTNSSEYSLTDAASSLELTYTPAMSAVPEPTDYAVIAGAVALGFAAIQRRNRRHLPDSIGRAG